MEIGPISAIRLGAAVRPTSPAPDLTGVFPVEFRDQQRDDTYSPRKGARGIEDENAEEETSGAEADEAAIDESVSGSISYFA